MSFQEGKKACSRTTWSIFCEKRICSHPNIRLSIDYIQEKLNKNIEYESAVF